MLLWWHWKHVVPSNCRWRKVISPLLAHYLFHSSSCFSSPDDTLCSLSSDQLAAHLHSMVTSPRFPATLHFFLPFLLLYLCCFIHRTPFPLLPLFSPSNINIWPRTYELNHPFSTPSWLYSSISNVLLKNSARGQQRLIWKYLYVLGFGTLQQSIWACKYKPNCNVSKEALALLM